MFMLEIEKIFNNEGSNLAIDHKLDMSEFEFSGMRAITKPVRILGKIRNKTGIVSINAQAQVDYSSICDRCAVPVERTIKVPLIHIFVTSLNDENNDDFTVIPDMKLNLDELAIEDILLTLPSKFLCKEDCKGLCTICGKNHNESDCTCKKPIDPRLESLMELLD